MRTAWLHALLGLAIAWAYVSYYLRPCPLRASLPHGVWAADCTPDVLAHKRPLVLLDRAARPRDLLSTVFRWQFVRAAGPEPLAPGGQARVVARARFTLLSCAGPGDATVELWHPRGPGADPDAAVRLHMGQTLVLPPWWGARVADGAGVTALRLYDTFHLALRALLPHRP